jgi:exodeoxyribonuclease-3
VAILAKGERPAEIRRGLPGDELDRQARYLEAEVKGLVVASVYLPNGNPQPGPKFDFKLAWFERFNAHARGLIDSGKPVVLAGDLNVVPTKADIYNEWLWRLDAVVQPAGRAHLHLLGERRSIPPQRGLPHGFRDAHAQPATAVESHRRR